jgi:hypothetical protein
MPCAARIEIGRHASPSRTFWSAAPATLSVRPGSARATLASGLITRQHLARYLLRSPGDDRFDGVIAHVFTGDVIDGLEPPPVMLDFQAYFGAPVFRYPAHAVACLARVGFQAGVPFFFVQHGVIPPSRAACGPSSTDNPACGHTHRRSWHYGRCSSCPPGRASRSDPLAHAACSLTPGRDCQPVSCPSTPRGRRPGSGWRPQWGAR